MFKRNSSKPKFNVEQKAEEFMLNDRDQDTKKRDKVQTKKFIKFAIPHYPLDSDDLTITWMNKRNKIHPDHLIDIKLAHFITHEFNYHQEKGNKLEPNLRATKSYIITSLLKAGMEPVKFPKFMSTWDGIKRDSKYIESKNHKQAPSASLQQHIKIKQVSVYDKNNMYDRFVIQERDAYGCGYGTMLRGDNLHKVIEEQVSVQDISNINRPYIVIKTNATKTCKKRQEWTIPCECPAGEKHSSFNMECPVAIQAVHSKLKYTDWCDHVKDKSTPYHKLPYFRRIRWVSNSNHKLGNYYDIQRRGEKHIRNCMESMAQRAGITNAKFTC